MDVHVKVLAILHIVFGAVGIMGGFTAVSVLGGVSALLSMENLREATVAIPILMIIGGIVLVLCLALSLPGIIVGIGLLKYRPWARIFGIVLSAIELANLPFGTALGIYGLWVLLNRETEDLFQITSSKPIYQP